MSDATVFEGVCREAAVWCSLAETHSRFRTPRLEPTLPEWPTAGDLERAVQALVMSRRTLLAGRSVGGVQGRLLVCEVNESISSGESEAATQGFFDINDRPAWDTWVASVPRLPESSEATLISWVPSELVGVVGQGIEVNPYDCIFWLADAERLLAEWPVARALAAHGLG
jgi:hypothetical protein